ncbi:putative uncharacterized protein GSN-AS1 [Rhinopithecus roxellana]|uniref:putative uncharacterized protein GSN-AS1 n=1 Tax=Rhinopithecus roxellana TaxID=61622 RepID=UPI0012378AF6|nr:putative uncharacterized protein GSN-AS1 [Rhinopithecus roxellana]
MKISSHQTGTPIVIQVAVGPGSTKEGAPTPEGATEEGHWGRALEDKWSFLFGEPPGIAGSSSGQAFAYGAFLPGMPNSPFSALFDSQQNFWVAADGASHLSGPSRPFGNPWLLEHNILGTIKKPFHLSFGKEEQLRLWAAHVTIWKPVGPWQTSHDSHTSGAPPLVNKSGDSANGPPVFSPLQSLWEEFLHLLFMGTLLFYRRATKALRGKATLLKSHSKQAAQPGWEPGIWALSPVPASSPQDHSHLTSLSRAGKEQRRTLSLIGKTSGTPTESTAATVAASTTEVSSRLPWAARAGFNRRTGVCIALPT